MIPVLLIARELDYGGVERDVTKYATELLRHGFSPRVACFRPGGVRWRELEASGIPLLAIPVTSFRRASVIRCFWKLRRHLVTNRIQILHAFDSATSLFAIPAAVAAGTPVTISSQLRFRSLVSKRMRYLLPVIDWISTGVFANCRAVRDDLRENWRIPERKLHVCYNGFRSEQFNPHERGRVAGLDHASVVIGTVTVLRPEKDVECLIHAFSQLIQINERARLVIVGDGPLRSRLMQCAESLDLVNSVVFTGADPNPELWMKSFDVYVNCSISESFSNSLLEAMACGCCPVASRIGGTPEMVTNDDGSVCGRLVAAGSVDELTRALTELCEDDAMRQSLADAAAKRAFEKFTIDASTECLASIYQGLLSQSAKGRQPGY